MRGSLQCGRRIFWNNQTNWNRQTISRACPAGLSPTVYWRVEGSLLDLTVVEPVAFFTWNAQTFAERWWRRGLIFRDGGAASLFVFDEPEVRDPRCAHGIAGCDARPAGSAGRRIFPIQIETAAEDARSWSGYRNWCAAGADVVLVSQGLEHVMKPLARHLGVKRVVANRLEFRDGVATGRLLEPVIRPRGGFALIREQSPDGRRAPKTLARQLDITLEELRAAVIRSGQGIGGAGTSDCAFRGAEAGGWIFSAAGAGGQACDADRRYRIYWQGMAGEYADGFAEDRADLSADPAAEVESGAAAV